MSIIFHATDKNPSHPPFHSLHPPISSIGNGILVTTLEIGKYYYYTVLEEGTKTDGIEFDFSKLSFSCAGEYQGEKRMPDFDIIFHSFKNYADTDNNIYITPINTGFYETNPEMELNCLPPAKEISVTFNPVENGYYAVTDVTKVVNQGKYNEFRTIEPSTYVGKHTGCWSEGWGKQMKEQVHFQDRGKEVIIIPTPMTAYYRVNPPQFPLDVSCTKIKNSSPKLQNTEYWIDLVPFNLSCCIFKKPMQPKSCDK